jgi:hypothetical protein
MYHEFRIGTVLDEATHRNKLSFLLVDHFWNKSQDLYGRISHTNLLSVGEGTNAILSRLPRFFCVEKYNHPEFTLQGLNYI